MAQAQTEKMPLTSEGGYTDESDTSIELSGYHDESEISIDLSDDKWEIPLPSQKATFWRAARTCLSWTRWILLAILPRFMTGNLPATDKLGPTAYLDGLRGWAAYCVYNHHQITESASPAPAHPFLAAGGPQVALFFIISGYALSYKMTTSPPDPKTLASWLPSSIFRRWMRLFIPVLIATFFSMILIYNHQMKTESSVVAKPQPTLYLQIVDWLYNFMIVSNPFGTVDGYWKWDHVIALYGYQMWTIPVEFRGSIILFLYIAMTYRMTPKRRLLLIALTLPFLYYWDAAYVALFLYGYVLALTAPASSPILPTTTSSSPVWRSTFLTALPFTLLSLAAYWTFLQPASFPHLDPQHQYFPWDHLAPYFPTDRWPHERTTQIVPGFAALVLVFCMQRVPLLRRPFETSVMQYMGQISFGLYLMHVTVLEAVDQKRLQPWRASHGKHGFWSSWAGWGVCYLFVLVIMISVADWFERVDRRVQGGVRWLWLRFSGGA